MAVTVLSESIRELIDPDAEPERLAGGLGFLEGPVWDPREGCLLFSDIPGQTRYRWEEREGLRAVARDTGKANGLAFDPEGRLVVCHHATSRVTRVSADGSEELLADSYEGRALNSPNDVVVRSDGLILFTDPPYGRISPEHGLPRPFELDHRGVYSLRPGSDPVLLTDQFEAPNGLCFGLEESTLYVNDSERKVVWRFRLGADGWLDAGEQLLAQEGDGNPDGMKLDERGNLWVTGPGGVWIVSPQGEHLGTIAVPETTANLAWDDGTTVYLCASTSLYRVRVKVPGAPTRRALR